MNVDYISDLHINHHVPFLSSQEKWESRTKSWTENLFTEPTGELLLLGGDFSEWNQQAFWFIEEASQRYKRTLLVSGNHDRYVLSRNQRKKYPTGQSRVDELFDKASGLKGVAPMQRSIVSVDGYTIAGDGLWYNLLEKEDVLWYLSNSNDSEYIYERVPREDTHTLLYNQSIEWYKSLEGKKIDVMLSHVPPVHSPLSSYRKNAAYECPVEFLAAPHWVCGHQHVQGTFKKAGTTFHMNALGYPMEKNDAQIQSFEI